MQKIINLFREMKMKRFILFILLANVLGTIYGWYYYESQLLNSPYYLWMFIADCPNSTLFFSVSLFLMINGKKNNFFNFFASANLIKYGIWTCFVLLFHRTYFFAVNFNLYSAMFVTHALLIVEGMLLAYATRFSKYAYLTLLWFLTNDYLDYFANTHPYMPEEGIEVVEILTFSLTIISFIIVYVLAKHYEKSILLSD
ncbi:hypothetical protein DRP05_04440 [Archaeoglobales archaeon]|nr:MAG: hypothetical protein DRP05_04440 [Archaeoglobales archaeon]